MAMAISDSVTVSMGLETSGDLRVIFLVRGLISSTSRGRKSMYPGSRIKSLYVNPWPSMISWEPEMVFITNVSKWNMWHLKWRIRFPSTRVLDNALAVYQVVCQDVALDFHQENSKDKKYLLIRFFCCTFYKKKYWLLLFNSGFILMYITN